MYLRKGKRDSEAGDVCMGFESPIRPRDPSADGSNPLPAAGSGRRNNWPSPVRRSDNKENEFHPDDLPDGACVAPIRLVQKDTECTAVREAAVSNA